MSPETPQSDAALLDAVRSGNAAAFGELYERHVAAARALARHLVRAEAEAEDVVAESFTRILDLVGRGGGPEAAFRPYLLTVVRRTVYDRGRVAGRQVTTGDIEEFDPGTPFVDPALSGLEKSLIAKAFLSLPDRWKAVLWHTEVEGAGPAEVAPLLGLSANGVAALAYRAREGLRQAYLQMHLSGTPQQSCRPVLGKMGAHVRGGLGRRDSRMVEEHMSACTQCRSVFLELSDVDRGLRVIVGPLVVGPAFAAYSAALAKAGSAGGVGATKAMGWIGRAPRHRQAAAAGGTAVALAAALVLLLVSGEEPDRPPPERARALPSAAPRLPPPAEERAERPEPERPQPVPAHRRPTPPPATAKPGAARLSARIDPLGSLVRGRPGIVALRVRNEGGAPSRDVVAAVDLPPGVTLAPSRWGRARTGSAGTLDGWACRPRAAGARCAREPLGPGRLTTVFLRVTVAPTAPEGVGPAARVRSGDQRVRVRATAGVRGSGAPARFAADGGVAVTAAGNTLLTCPPEEDGCERGRRREGDRRDNDLWPMRRLDEDDVAGTGASSSAVLELPRGGRVVWAGLYWSAGLAAGGPIKVRPPGRKGYVTVEPDEVAVRELPSGPAYQAFADVTGLVAAASGRRATWWAADVPLGEGVSQHAGWSLVVVSTDPARPYSQAVVVDAATVVGGGRDEEVVPLGGLYPAAVPADVRLVAWEGDADLKGDRVSAGSAALRPAGGDGDEGNVFDGSAEGAEGLAFGVDVDSFQAELGADPRLELATAKDVVLFGVAAVSVRARS
ncbi:sigma-70 family RNA polymerase sigma factor [Thermoactinospora rubra]|uniref:sigma-70 family RNA polymerase sigma factor n=1 Tax=Thermoactinospora rubra TaxID=1088767 RepID=UPI000A0F9976|nr:sigma-70 family RNA polymerase sigma factor [Thermoactinospora rubra]